MPERWYEIDIGLGIMIQQLGGPKWEHGECGLSVSRSAELLIRCREIVDTMTGTAIDVGCGTGAVAAFLSRLGLRITATDLYPETIRLARNNTGKNRESCNVIYDDWREPRLFDARFDNVIACDPCESVPELVEFMRSHWTGRGAAIICDPGRFKQIEGMRLDRIIENDEFATNVWSLI